MGGHDVVTALMAVRAYKDLLVRGSGLREVLPAVGVLMGFTVVFIGLGLLRFNKLEQGGD